VAAIRGYLREVVLLFILALIFSSCGTIKNITRAYVADWGTCLGEYNGVKAYYDGSNSCARQKYNHLDNYCTGMKWQCVEYVNRYYYKVYGMKIRVIGDDANDYFDRAPERDLHRYANGGTVSPQLGDILCSNGGKWGHVAIVREVRSNGIYVIHQNWSNTNSDVRKFIRMSVSNGRYNVGGFSYWYPVQGWLRPRKS